MKLIKKLSRKLKSKFKKSSTKFKIDKPKENILLNSLSDHIQNGKIRYIDGHSHIFNAYCAVKSVAYSLLKFIIIEAFKEIRTSQYVTEIVDTEMKSMNLDIKKDDGNNNNNNNNRESENDKERENGGGVEVGAENESKIRRFIRYVEGALANSVSKNLDLLYKDLNKNFKDDNDNDDNNPVAVVILPIDFDNGDLIGIKEKPLLNVYEQQMITFALSGCDENQWMEIYKKLRSIKDKKTGKKTIPDDSKMFKKHGLKWNHVNDLEDYENILVGLRNNLKMRGKVLPAVAFDPRRLNDKTYREFVQKDALSLGGVAYKIYPALGYNPKDYYDVFKEIAKARIPIYSHSTPGSIWGGKKENAKLGSPKNFSYLIKKIPTLKINMCHFGGQEEMIKIGKEKNWSEIVKNLISGENQSYTDISYTAAYDECNTMIKKWLLEENSKILNKVIYGQDNWLVLAEKDIPKFFHDAHEFYGDELFSKLALENTFKFLTDKELPK